MTRLRRTLTCVLTVVLAVAFAVPTQAAEAAFAAATMSVSPPNGGWKIYDRTASGSTALQLLINSTATKNISVPDSTSVVVRAKASYCQGRPPTMVVAIDGIQISATAISATQWTDYTSPVAIRAGNHALSIAATSGRKSKKCIPTLLLDRAVVTPAAASNPNPDPVGASPLGAVTPFSATDVNNPKRGQYENLMEGLFPQTYPAQRAYPEWPAAFDASDRFSWRAIQPAPTTYDFSRIDAEIAQSASAGKRFSFRVTPFSSCCSTDYPNNVNIDVPEWLRNIRGATSNYTLGGVTHVIPNWNDPSYLTATENLITALGQRYNKDERVEWFEFSGYGDFSENHVSFMRDELGLPGPGPSDSIAKLGYYSQYQDQWITKASITRLVNATLRAFPDTQVVTAPGNPEIIRQLFSARPLKPVGVRSDCLGVYEPPDTWAVNMWSYYVQTRDPVVQALLDRWKTAPMVTEWCNWQPDGDLAYFQKALRDTVNYHVSLVSSAVTPYQGSTKMPAAIYDLWARTTKYAGYRYAVTAVDLPATAQRGTNLQATVRWTNFGTAPTYDNWQINYDLRDASGRVAKSGASALPLTNLAAAQNYTDTSSEPSAQSANDSFTVPTDGLSAGTYTLVARVVWNEHKSAGTNVVNLAPMNLAQEGRDSTGSYALAQFQLQ